MWLALQGRNAWRSLRRRWIGLDVKDRQDLGNVPRRLVTLDGYFIKLEIASKLLLGNVSEILSRNNAMTPHTNTHAKMIH